MITVLFHLKEKDSHKHSSMYTHVYFSRARITIHTVIALRYFTLL